jgi:chromosome partitioning protein
VRIISLLNQKGGVGKTTTTVNLGAALALLGKRVVVVDLDPQANLSVHLGIEVAAGEPSAYRVLLGEVGFGEAIVATATPGLGCLPTDLDLSGAELELANQFGRETLLRDAVRAWRDDVLARTGDEPADFVLLDCPPSLGLLSINALAASDEVFICVQTEFFALRGLSKLMDVVRLVQRRLHPALRVTGIIPCLYDNRLKLAREVLAELKRYCGDQVFARHVGVNVKLAEAPSYAQTIFEYAPESTGARDYRLLAEEVLERAGGEPAVGSGSDAEPTAAAGDDDDVAHDVLVPRPATPDADADPVEVRSEAEAS